MGEGEEEKGRKRRWWWRRRMRQTMTFETWKNGDRRAERR